MSKATKVPVVDQYAVQKLSQQENRQESKPKTTKQQEKHTTKTKTKQKRQREVGSQPAMGITCMMTSYVLCVILRMAQNKKHNRTNTKHTKGLRWWVREATKLHAETRDPPSQDPRDHKEQPFRHDITPRHFEANTDNAGSQRSGEKRKKGETGR